MSARKVRRRAIVGTVAVLCMGASLAACSSSDSNESTGSTDGSSSDEIATWCTSVQNLIDQSGGADALSVSGNMAAMNEALVSLATTAPDGVYDDMQTLATVSSAAVEADQMSPPDTLPDALQAQGIEAWDSADAFVQANCSIELPPLTA